MKRIKLLLLGCLVSLASFSQRNEFEVFPNGYIYSEKTMSQLNHIVDSLNLKFKYCDLDRTYYSVSQAIGAVVVLKSGDLNEAKKLMSKGISLDDFKSIFEKADIKENRLITRSIETNYTGVTSLDFEAFDLKGYRGRSVSTTDLILFKKDLKGAWVYNYSPKTQYSEEVLEAFYFPEGFKSIVIGEKYARMIQYADCLIDTNTTKMRQDLEEGYVDMPDNWRKMSVERQNALLEEMRTTRVVGFCSQDSRPRQHAVNIAMVSAEVNNWEVFLKAHLDIMNDRFDRVSDGSYAWGARNTYLKELEALDINTHDLMLGISLRIENPAQNHYYASISRMGRALSESDELDKIDQTVLLAIQDPELDDLNRLYFYFIYKNTTQYLMENGDASDRDDKLNAAIQSLPYDWPSVLKVNRNGK